MGRSRKNVKKAVLIDEDNDEEESVVSRKRTVREEVWNAVEYENVGPVDSDVVFGPATISDLLKKAVDKAWEDGVITSDEMALLEVLKDRLMIDDKTFDRIINERRPDEAGSVVVVEGEEEELDFDEEYEDLDTEEEDEEDEDLEEEDAESEEDEDDEDLEEYEDEEDEDLEEEDAESEEDEDDEHEFEEDEDQDLDDDQDTDEGIEEAIEYIGKERAPPSEPPVIEERIAPPPKPPDIITLTHHVRGEARPLDKSFDLSKKQAVSALATKRCPHCRSLIRIDPESGKTTCPVCGRKVTPSMKETPGLRKILDMAKQSFKKGEIDTARELYQAVLEQSPGNKEAQFYLQKMKARTTPSRAPVKDARNIPVIDTGSRRLDQLLGGGVNMGDTILIEGPPFCGKEILLDQIMASALNKGMPVIYVSSNRAMKEVMKGIIKKVPEFKRYNHEGLVRMYDLFSKHRDHKVLKEGHRIFNIEDKEDFIRFQNDLVFVQEELVKIYHGGLLIINSLSPLISQVDQNDLMKFLQVLIARSKSYRFTNVLDMAAGVHTDSMVNSVEYLMDGIMELKEQDMKNILRLKGFSHNILSRDWVDYVVRDEMIHIVGSFMEERIV